MIDKLHPDCQSENMTYGSYTGSAGQVTEELKELDSRLHHLTEVVAQLEELLQPVLKEEMNAARAGEPVEEKVLVPLAREIRGSRRSIEDLSSGVKSMIDRLEL